MARIYQRVCDRCFAKSQDDGGVEAGWNEFEISEGDFDLCPSCSAAFVTWVATATAQSASVPVAAG